MKILKAIAFLNIIGFTILTMALYISVILEPFPWDTMWVLANVQIGLPFIIFGIITLRNVKQPDTRIVKIGFIICYLSVWGPSTALPFASLVSGIIIFAFLLVLGIYGLFYIKEPLKKMRLFNWLGILFLIADAFGVIAILIANQ